MRFIVVPLGFAVGIAFFAISLIVFWPLAIIAFWLDLIFLGAYLHWNEQETLKRQQFQQFLARPRVPAP